jgi:NAD(P)-dependent dehydrogenase (short-subunit alcohol dehydrogenase family)
VVLELDSGMVRAELASLVSLAAVTGADRRVVLTGAAGRIGRSITPQLSERWNLRLTDLEEGPGIEALDVTDLAACRALFAGADAVVHLAAVPDPDASWDQLLPANVMGAYHVARAAAHCGVRRLVLASSLHVMSAGPDETQVRASDSPRPGNLYGATKAWAEAVGAWVAKTTATSVVALRIGYFSAEAPIEGRATTRELASWLSAGDAAELVRASVEAEGVDFLVANGVSANRYRFADLQETMRRLDYQPRDDAWNQADQSHRGHN